MKSLRLIPWLALVALLVTACASAITPTTAPVARDTVAIQPADQIQQGMVDIVMKGFAFSPDKITVKAGTTVTWTNQDPAGHDVTASDGSFRSGTLNQGDTFSFQFNQTGTYAYTCTFHPGMQGEITVVP